jgi:hypothetical protein
VIDHRFASSISPNATGQDVWSDNSIFDRSVNWIRRQMSPTSSITTTRPSEYIEDLTSDDIDSLLSYQRRTLDSDARIRFINSNGLRQTGKTVTCIWDSVHAAMRYPGLNVAFICPTQKRAQSVRDQILDYAGQYVHSDIVVPADSSGLLGTDIQRVSVAEQRRDLIAINNGSSIQTLPASTIDTYRHSGRKYDFVVFDDMAYYGTEEDGMLGADISNPFGRRHPSLPHVLVATDSTTEPMTTVHDNSETDTYTVTPRHSVVKDQLHTSCY